ncbi:unnamed protein product [Mytilus edulis]|uniref:Methyltransferase domain-containing protein n=1 Tax=Mytilus edulis TaxID=6550 RepID=A0A8S3T2L7_MYTED|nr:unnamed protein product [Mytilus edulis]
MKYMYLVAVHVVHLVMSRSTNDVQTDKKYDVCGFTVSQSSKENFKTEWINSDSLIAKFKLEIYDRNMKPMIYSKANETFLPLEWSVTLGHESKGNLYTSWMIDNWLYSFGLLDARTLTNITIQLISTSSSCQIIFGENETVQSITTALHTLPVKTWREYDKKRKTIKTYWCFYSAYPRITESAWYTAKIYFGFAIRMFGYRCCYKTRTELFECTDENGSRLNQYQLMPYYVGMVFFCFFPIMLMKCSARSMKSGSKIRTAKQTSYQSLDLDDEYLYLQKRSPVSVASLFLGICGLGFKHPVAATRIRRIVFVLGLPLFVYLEILMYYIGWPELAPALVKNKIPFGFTSILGGLSESRSLFLPMFGGPFIALFLYFVAGIVLLVIPVDHGSHIEMGLPSDNGAYSSLLSINVATIEKLSSKRCLNRIDKEYNNHETHLFNTQLSSDQVADYYDRWAENGRYDEEIKNTLKAPEITAKTTITLYDQSVRPSIEILDIGAGTGLVAEMLRKSGFQKIDALDPSKGMLEKAKEKNLYRNYVCELLTKETFKNANGGHVVIAMRDEWEAPGYSDSIKTRMRQLIDDGKWVKTHEELYNHYFDKAGVVYVFQVA